MWILYIVIDIYIYICIDIYMCWFDCRGYFSIVVNVCVLVDIGIFVFYVLYMLIFKWSFFEVWWFY